MKNIPGFEGYSITADGRVFTHRKRFGLGKGNGGGVRIDPTFCKELEIFPGHGNYLYVSIKTFRGQRNIPLHSLLAVTFVGACPVGQEVRHLDGNCLNNAIDNLAYGTPKQNAADRLRCGKAMQGASHPRAKLTAEQVKEIRSLKGTTSARQIAEKYGIARSTVSNLVRGHGWKSI